MAQDQLKSGTGAESPQTEALSNEVLKLKIDDLFQEVESLKRRVALVEQLVTQRLPGGSAERLEPAPVSDPDRH